MSVDRTINVRKRDSALAPLARTLAAAFQDDPALAWIVPDADKRRRMLPRFFAVMAEQSVRHGEVLANEDASAASLWYPPGEVRDGAFDSVRDNLRLLAQFGAALPRGLKVADEMVKRHPNPQPYAYLRYVGVSPEAQGKGLGGAIIREAIRRAHDKGQGVLLETATESNVAIYTRLGFEIAEEWQVPGANGSWGPQFWTMIHPAP